MPFRILTVLAALALSSLVRGAEPPRIYAIRDATIVVSPGVTIESGTVVLRDGRIAAVGAAIDVPADAVEIPSNGSWIYPGWIDAYGTLGMRSDEESRAKPERNPPPPGAVHPVSRIRPETRARDRLLPFSGERKIDAARRRELGFTVVLAAPQAGVLRGRSVAILLAEDEPVSHLILRDDVAQHGAFEHGRFGEDYPTSLMGAVAAMRQAVHDAARFGVWSARYASHPRDVKRPETHAAYEALISVVSGEQPLFLAVKEPDDALLASRLADELDLRLVVVASGHEWEIAAQVAATGWPLILPVGLPDRPEVSDEDEALDATNRELRRYLEASSAPAKLHEAGVSFALTTHGLKNTADFWKNLRRMVERGLSRDAALAALTTVPAKLLGIDHVAGTVEPGKIANLIVADGPLFEEGAKPTRVFVEGREYVPEARELPRGDPDAVVDPRGDWSVVFELGERTVQRTWTLSGEPGGYVGTAETRAGIVTFESVTLEGNLLTVTFPPRGGGGSTDVVVVIEGESFEGTAEMGARRFKVSGSRTAGPRGDRR